MKDIATDDFIKVKSMYKDGTFDYYIIKVTDIDIVQGITLESSNEDFNFTKNKHNLSLNTFSYEKITDQNKIKKLEAKYKLNLIKNS